MGVVTIRTFRLVPLFASILCLAYCIIVFLEYAKFESVSALDIDLG